VEIALEQNDLQEAANVVASLLKRSATTLPVLSNMLIDASETDRVLFLGTDLESFVRIRVPATIKGGNARLTVPADKMAELVSLLPSGTTVRLIDEGGHVRIVCDANEYNLVTLPPDDYPNWHPETPTIRFTITQKQLKALLDAVLYAVPSKDHRRVLMGALMELQPEGVRLTATDGKKLSRMRVPKTESEGEGVQRAVVSGKLLADVRRVLRDEGLVTVELGPKQVCFQVDHVEYRTNMIEGKYPDCDAVIPKDFPHQVRLNRNQFEAAARRAGVVSEDKTKSIILKFEDGRCHFTSMAADVGTFSGDVPVEYQGKTLEIAFNYELMIETLNSFSHPDIKLNIKSEQSPCVLICDEEPEHLCVLMPIKLADIRGGIME
jgi:DNA polymerase-3 subunit beta